MGALKFEDNRGRTITVQSIENNIAILNNGERVAVERLKDRNFYTPLNETVSTISTHQPQSQQTVVNENNSNPIMTSDEARYHAIAQNKSYSIGDDGGDTSVMRPTQRGRTNPTSDIRMSGSVVESHNDNLRAIGKDVVEETVVPVSQPYQPSNVSKEEELMLKYGAEPAPPKSDPKLEELAYGKKVTREEIREKRKERIDNIDYSDHVDEQFLPPSQRNQQPIEPEPEINPVHQMFDSAKKVHPLNVTLKLNEKIPTKDVIKMMEENFDESAVDYYAKDIFKKLMEDPSVIENQVKEAIEKYLKSRTKKK